MNQAGNPIPQDLVLWQVEFHYFLRLRLQKEYTFSQIESVIVHHWEATNGFLPILFLSPEDLNETYIEANDKIQNVLDDLITRTCIASAILEFVALFRKHSIDCYYGGKNNSLIPHSSHQLLMSLHHGSLLMKSQFEKISDTQQVRVSQLTSREIINQYFKFRDDCSPPIEKLCEEDPFSLCFKEIFFHHGYKDLIETFTNESEYSYPKQNNDWPLANAIVNKWGVSKTDAEGKIIPRLLILFKELKK